MRHYYPKERHHKKYIKTLKEKKRSGISWKIIKRKKVDMKPMSEEEAMLQLDLLGHDFFVFYNIDTDSACILYKRKDGYYGLIDTK